MGRINKKQGIALISALSFLVITAIFVGIALLVSVSNKRLSVSSSHTYKAQLAAEAGLEHALYQSYYQLKLNKAQELNLENIRKKLDDIGLRPSFADDKAKFGKALKFEARLDSESKFEVKLRRIDLQNKTVIRLDSSGYLGTKANALAVRRISQDIEFVEGTPDSASFAVFSNSSKGVFSNSIISTLNAAYEKAKLLNLRNLSQTERELVANNYRVKVASLKAIYDDSKEVNSLVSGTIYSRGYQQILSSNRLRGIPFKQLNGEDASVLSDKANMVFSRLKIQDCANGCSEKNAAFYRNYPIGSGPDIDLIKEFPLAIEDDDNDNEISRREWLAAIAKDNRGGKLKGGRKLLYSEQLTVADTKTLISGSDGISANAVLSGSRNNPLILNGSVYFDGDVVISGQVTGSGRIIARGNIYVVGDLRYSCDGDSQDFEWFSSASVDCDYSELESLPKLGLLSAKNIIIGDYGGGTISDDAENLETLSHMALQIALFNQHEYENSGRQSKYYSLGNKVYRCSACNNSENLIEIETSELEASTVINLAPSNNWLSNDGASSEVVLHNIWKRNVELNNMRGLKSNLHIDALLHANHGIFGHLAKNSRTNGGIQINGSVFADNIGLDAKGGLAIYYDERLSRMIDIDDVEIRVRRTNYRLIKQNSRLNYEAVDGS